MYTFVHLEQIYLSETHCVGISLTQNNFLQHLSKFNRYGNWFLRWTSCLQMFGRILSNTHVWEMSQMRRRIDMQRRLRFFKIWLLVGMAERDTQRSLQTLHCESLGGFTSIRCFKRSVPFSDPNALQVSKRRVLPGWSGFSMWNWLPRSTLSGLQLRIL